MVTTGSLIITAMLEPEKVDRFFRRKRLDWPLHVTLVQWFTLEQLLQASFITQLRSYAKTVVATQFRIGDDAYFGADGDIPVNKVIDDGTLGTWHDTLLKLVERAGGVIVADKRQWTGQAYRPHVTHHGAERLHTGDTVLLNNFTLTILKDDDICEVINVISLGGGHEAAA